MSISLDGWLVNAAAQNGKKTFWYRGDEKLSYQFFLNKIQSCHGWFDDIGVKKGDRILLLTGNDAELLPLILGAWRAGIVVGVVDPKVTREELIPILADIAPRLIVGDRCHADMVDSGIFVEVKPKKAKRGLLAKLKKKSSEQSVASYPEVLNALDFSGRCVSVSESDDALILFSSGTTGLPKGMVLSFDAIFNDVMAISKRMGYTQEHRIHNALPLHHVDGLLHGPLLILLKGAALVRCDPFSAAAVEAYVNEMYRHNITHLISVPTILSFIHRQKELFEDLFSWPEFQYVISTAGPLNATFWQAFQADFKVRVCNVYGLSETTIAASISGPDDASFKVGTVGKPLAGASVKIIDEQGKALAAGGTGEIVISGNMLFSGYLNNPDATRDAFIDGWLKTGDLGFIDNDGLITVSGRKKNTIIKGGENINPEELAACLLKHEAVIQAEVVGLPDENWGETIAACLVSSSNQVSSAELMSHCARFLAPTKLPDHIFFFDEVPVGPSGKVMRKKLIALCQSERNGGLDSARVISDTTDMVFSIAADIFKINKAELSLDSVPGNTLGWDSLAHLNLLLSIEKEFKLSFTAREMMRMDSMKEVIRLIKEKRAIS